MMPERVIIFSGGGPLEESVPEITRVSPESTPLTIPNMAADWFRDGVRGRGDARSGRQPRKLRGRRVVVAARRRFATWRFD